MYKTKIERLFRLQHANPKRILKLHIPFSNFEDNQRRMAPPADLCNSTLLWQPADKRGFHSLDLETGKTHSFEIPGRVSGEVICTTGDHVLVDTVNK
jgi:hypothetical protein